MLRIPPCQLSVSLGYSAHCSLAVLNTSDFKSAEEYKLEINYRVSCTKLLLRRVHNSQQRSFFWHFFSCCCYATIAGDLWFIVYRIWACEQLLRHLKYACFYSTCKKGHFWALSQCLCAHEWVSVCLNPIMSGKNFLIPTTAPRQLKMENCSLFSPTHASHSTFVSNTQHLYLSGSRAGSKHHRCSSSVF